MEFVSQCKQVWLQIFCFKLYKTELIHNDNDSSV